jgi:hypothetical protein
MNPVINTLLIRWAELKKACSYLPEMYNALGSEAFQAALENIETEMEECLAEVARLLEPIVRARNGGS